MHFEDSGLRVFSGPVVPVASLISQDTADDVFSLQWVVEPLLMVFVLPTLWINSSKKYITTWGRILLELETQMKVLQALS